MSERPTSQQIDEQAAAWVARCDSGELGEAEAQELQAWLASDVRASGALLRAQALWEGVQGLEAMGRHRGEAFTRRRLLRWGGAATCVAGAAALWPALHPGKAYATEVGEVMRLPLAYGASVTLNTDSRVRVGQRNGTQVIRVERGEAYFAITPSAALHTEVHIDARVLTPAASTFSVRRHDGSDAVVTVEKGALRVDHLHGVPANAVVRLSQDRVAISDVRAADVERGLMWLQGKLVFEGEPLAQAAQDFARYGRPLIVIPDARLAAEPVVGLFDANDAQGFATAVATSLNARVEPQGERLIILR